MSLALSVSGASDVARAIREAQDRAQDAVQAVVERYADAIAREAKGFAPVDTGALRGSIRTALSRFSADILAGDDEITYAAFVELGTINAAAQPFLAPAFEANRAPFVRDLKAAVVAAVSGNPAGGVR